MASVHSRDDSDGDEPALENYWDDEELLAERPYSPGNLVKGVYARFFAGVKPSPLQGGDPAEQRIGTARNNIQDALGRQGTMNDVLEVFHILSGKEGRRGRPRIPLRTDEGERTDRYLAFARMIGEDYQEETMHGPTADLISRLAKDWVMDYWVGNRAVVRISDEEARVFRNMLADLLVLDNDRVMEDDLARTPPRDATSGGELYEWVMHFVLVWCNVR